MAAFDPPGRVRIIGGEWRRRWLAVPVGVAVRPSSDRVRETVFNWLAMRLPGARCLDLFAGSGALGLEALSRGAGAVTLVESDSQVVVGLRLNVAQLGATLATIVHALDIGGEPVPEANGLEAVMAGARERLNDDDDALLAEMSSVLDSLYAHFVHEAQRGNGRANKR